MCRPRIGPVASSSGGDGQYRSDGGPRYLEAGDDGLSDWKDTIKHLSTVHRQGSEKNIFIVSTARSGTTWLAELFATQGRFQVVHEPFNLRVDVVRETLGLDSWGQLLRPENKPCMRRYLQSFIDNRDVDRRFKRETPFSEFWHPVTDRVIFKILFAGEDDLDWFRRELGGHLVFLLRHPIPVAQSREEFPRLDSFMEPPFSENFTPGQLAAAREVRSAGNRFEIAVLDWCFQNALPLRQVRPEWTVLSYEQLVLDPEGVIGHLAARLRLGAPDRMLARLYKASGSTGKSSRRSQEILRDPDAMRRNRRWLVDKWREHASPEQVEAAFRLLSTFGISYYQRHDSLPPAQYLIHAAQDIPASGDPV